MRIVWRRKGEREVEMKEVEVERSGVPMDVYDFSERHASKTTKSIKSIKLSKSQKKSVIFAGIIGVVLISAIFLTMFLAIPAINKYQEEGGNLVDNDLVDDTFSDNTESSNSTIDTESPKELYYELNLPNLTKSCFPIILSSNGLEYVDEVSVLINDSVAQLSQKDDIERIYPIYAFSFNRLLKTDKNFNICSNEQSFEGNARIFFDVSNYSLESFFDYRLVSVLSTSYISNISLELSQNIVGSEIVLNKSEFNERVEYSTLLQNPENGILDVSYFFSSINNYRINLSCYIEIVKKYDEGENRLYIVNQEMTGPLELKMELVFNETIEVDDNICDSLELEKEFISDQETPSVNYELTEGVLSYNVSDDGDVKIVYSVYGEEGFYSYNLTETSSSIEANKSIKYYSGLLIAYDTAGNLIIQEISYAENMLGDEGDDDPNDETNKISDVDWLFLLIPIIMCATVVCLIVFTLKEALRKKDVVKQEVVGDIDEFEEINKIDYEQKKHQSPKPCKREELKDFLKNEDRIISTFDLVSKVLGAAIIQSAIFMVVIKGLEIFNILWMVVVNFNDDMFTIGELALIFGIAFSISDVLAETVRFHARKIFSGASFISILMLAVITSFIQFSIFVSITEILSNLGVITIQIVDSQKQPIDTIYYYLFFAVVIFAIEVFIELVRRAFIIHKFRNFEKNKNEGILLDNETNVWTS